MSIKPLRNLTVILKGFEEEGCVVEYRDAYSGEVVRKESVKADGGRIVTAMEELDKGIALKIYRYMTART